MSLSESNNDVDSKTETQVAVKVLPAGDVGKHTGGDRALDILEHSTEVPMDPAALKKLLWKIDLTVMPVMMLCEFFQFLDKSAISYAKLFDFTTDNNLVGKDFAWLGAIFYLGYLFWQPFAAILLVKIPIKWHLGGVVILWGTVLALHAACHNFAGLATCRFFLGMTESAMVPILGSITGMWYTRQEQATRVGIWFGSVGMSQIIGGLVAYGMFQLNTDVIQKWQFIFILLGPVTVLFGLYILWIIPSNPATAAFLSPDERILAVERIRSNKTGTTGNIFKAYQVWEAVKDPRFYLASLGVISASIPNGGISTFGATIVAGFGYNTKQTTLLGMSTGVSETVAMFCGVMLSRFTKMRGIPAAMCIFVSIVGAIIMIALPTHLKNARFAGYCLVFWYPVGQMLAIPWMQSMVAGTTKRATFYALYQICYAAGNIIGTQMYPSKDSPDYTPAKIGTLACLVVCMCSFPTIAWINWRENKRRDRLAGEEQEEVKNIEFMDLTDREIPSFRYPL